MDRDCCFVVHYLYHVGSGTTFKKGKNDAGEGDDITSEVQDSF